MSKSMRKPKSFKIRLEIEAEVRNPGNGDRPIVTEQILFDLEKYIFINLLLKGVKVTYKIVLVPVQKGKVILEEKGGTL